MFPAKYTYPLLGLEWLQWYQLHKVYHPGIDLGTAGNSDCGQPVMAARDGEVVCTHNNVATSSGFGKFVVLKHMDGNYTRYAHLQEIKVEKGQQLIEGTVLGLLGNTGTQYCHLHFEVFRDSMRVIQTGHWRPWRYYPSNQSKAWVQQHYINPWEWLKTPQEKDDLEVAYDWAKNIKLIKSSLPKDTVQIDQLCVILDRFREYFKL